MYVNNEIGTIMPLQEISRVIRDVRKHRDAGLPLYLHTDAVQAIQYLPCGVDELGVDLLSLTGHKFHGPKGSGALYVRKGIQFVRQIDGGGQEYYHRGGTENVAGIVGMGAALADIAEHPRDVTHLRELQQYLISFVSENIPHAPLTGHPTFRASHITSFVFENVDPEALVIALDRAGFAVSSGSACSSGVVKQSHVIDALTLAIPKKTAALRVSTYSGTTQGEIQQFANSLARNVHNLREMGI
jgi:cysteine desulfurase